jgi:hypothetical protein
VIYVLLTGENPDFCLGSTNTESEWKMTTNDSAFINLEEPEIFMVNDGHCCNCEYESSGSNAPGMKHIC